MNGLFELTTYRALFEVYPPGDFFIRKIDEDGPYYVETRYALAAGEIDINDFRWQAVIRVIWNESHTIACIALSVHPEANPDRPCLVFVHKSEIFGK